MDAGEMARKHIMLMFDELQYDMEASHHEVAPGQVEVDMRYQDALTMADNVMTYRLIVKQVAEKNGVYATFMPKPVFGINGSGMHVHQSLFKGNRNAFFDEKGMYHLSKTALSFLAGLLKYAPEFTSVTSQWVNSYKRLVPGYEAPVNLAYSQRNRSAVCRIPVTSSEKSKRIEFRAPDATSKRA